MQDQNCGTSFSQQEHLTGNGHVQNEHIALYIKINNAQKYHIKIV
jgi:hypothetical protein